MKGKVLLVFLEGGKGNKLNTGLSYRVQHLTLGKIKYHCFRFFSPKGVSFC